MRDGIENLQTMDVQRAGTVATVRFNRPHEHNTASARMLDELYSVLVALSGEDDLAVVILTGSGTTFCPGADVTADRTSDVEASRFAEPDSYHVASLLVEMPQLTVAAVNGACAGAGFAFAAACDLRIASSRARFATAFLHIGLAGELGLAWTLQRHLGGALARELCFLPEKLDADRARSIGLVSRVYDEARWDDGLAGFRAELAGRSLDAVRTMKRNFVDAMTLPLREFLDLEEERHRAAFTGDRGAATRQRLARQRQHLRAGPENPHTN